jgi:hypothetical protein
MTRNKTNCLIYIIDLMDGYPPPLTQSEQIQDAGSEVETPPK